MLILHSVGTICGDCVEMIPTSEQALEPLLTTQRLGGWFTTSLLQDRDFKAKNGRQHPSPHASLRLQHSVGETT